MPQSSPIAKTSVPLTDILMVAEPTVRNAVEFAITTEQLGAKAYQRLARKFKDDPELQQVFAQLAEDEVEHEKQFSALRELVPKQDPKQYAEKWGILRAMSISNFFARDRVFGKQLEDIKTPTDALECALEMEKATLGYYQAFDEILGGNEIVQSLIAAEKNHVLVVMRCMISESKFRGSADKW